MPALPLQFPLPHTHLSRLVAISHAGWMWLANPLLAAELPLANPEPPAGAQQVVTDELVGRYFLEARTNNHGLRSLSLGESAARANHDAIPSWLDPRISGTYIAQDSRHMSSRMFGDFAWGIRQPLPLWNEPELRRGIAAAGVGVAGARTLQGVAALRQDLHRELLAVAYWNQSLELLRENVRWLQTTITTAEERFRVRAGSHHGLMRLQNERGLQENELVTGTNRLRDAWVAANRWLGRPLDEPAPALRLPREFAPPVFSSNLVQLAVRHSPVLRQLRAGREQAERQIELTRIRSRPEVGVGVATRQYSGDWAFREGQFMIELSIPWFNRRQYARELERDETRAEVITAEITDQEAGLGRAIHRVLTDLDEAHRGILIHRDEIQLRTQEALATAVAKWQLNQANVDEVLELRRKLLDDQLMILKGTLEQHRQRAGLLFLLGFETWAEVMAELRLTTTGSREHHEK